MKALGSVTAERDQLDARVKTLDTQLKDAKEKAGRLEVALTGKDIEHNKEQQALQAREP